MTEKQRILQFPEVQQRTGGKARSTYWRWMRSGLFPRAIAVGPHSIGWLESQIDEWINSRAERTYTATGESTAALAAKGDRE